MKTTTKNTGIKVSTNIRAASIGTLNHSGAGLKVRAGIKSGSTISVQNHNSQPLAIK
jgi:hypothetical protein